MQSKEILSYDKDQVRIIVFDVANNRLQVLMSIHGKQKMITAGVADLNYWAFKAKKVMDENGNPHPEAGEALITDPFSSADANAALVMEFLTAEGKLTKEMIWDAEFEAFWNSTQPTESDLFMMEKAA